MGKPPRTAVPKYHGGERSSQSPREHIVFAHEGSKFCLCANFRFFDARRGSSAASGLQVRQFTFPLNLCIGLYDQRVVVDRNHPREIDMTRILMTLAAVALIGTQAQAEDGAGLAYQEQMQRYSRMSKTKGIKTKTLPPQSMSTGKRQHKPFRY